MGSEQNKVELPNQKSAKGVYIALGTGVWMVIFFGLIALNSFQNTQKSYLLEPLPELKRLTDQVALWVSLTLLVIGLALAFWMYKKVRSLRKTNQGSTKWLLIGLASGFFIAYTTTVIYLIASASIVYFIRNT